MITPEQPGAPAASGIYTRINTAIAAARFRRTALTASHVVPTDPALFLGTAEWEELKGFCALWGVTWSGGIEPYDPIHFEGTRAHFDNVKIYRVDAASFLAAT